jgi:hypothetical protein
MAIRIAIVILYIFNTNTARSTNASIFKRKGWLLMVETQHYDALRCTAYVIELAKALGKSKRLSLTVYDEMDDSKDLFAKFGIRIPYRVTKTQEVYFSKLKEPIQELAVQCINVLRFHKDVEEIGKYVMATQLTNDLSVDTLKEALSLTKSFPVEFDLDENNIPVEVKVDNCPLKAFERHMLTKFIFVDNMDEFWVTPTPRMSKVANYGLRAKTPAFNSNIRTPNILFAF